MHSARGAVDHVTTLREAKKTVTEENGLVVETGNGGREGIEESCTAGDYLHLTSSPEAAEGWRAHTLMSAVNHVRSRDSLVQIRQTS